jgi:alkylation response protein AidB-like acyl-CoA dehydrogenase
MAGAFKAAAGIAPLPVRARRDRDGLVLHGRIAWASNLHDDTLAVLAVDVEGEGPLIVALPLSTPGVEVRPAHGLLALEATASGQVILDGAQVAEDAVHPEPFDAFITRVRRPFLVLQSAFCLGLARAALDAGEQCLGGLGAEFADDHAQLSDEYTRLEQALGELADDRDAPTRELLTLRLHAAALARDAGRVEAAVTGGRGYLAASPTARRLREAAFLPIQSPTEGHLRWELRRLG